MDLFRIKFNDTLLGKRKIPCSQMYRKCTHEVTPVTREGAVLYHFFPGSAVFFFFSFFLGKSGTYVKWQDIP